MIDPTIHKDFEQFVALGGSGASHQTAGALDHLNLCPLHVTIRFESLSAVSCPDT